MADPPGPCALGVQGPFCLFFHASAPGEQAEGQAGPAQGKGIHRPHVRNSPHLPTSTLWNVHCAPPPFYISGSLRHDLHQLTATTWDSLPPGCFLPLFPEGLLPGNLLSEVPEGSPAAAPSSPAQPPKPAASMAGAPSWALLLLLGPLSPGAACNTPVSTEAS